MTSHIWDRKHKCTWFLPLYALPHTHPNSYPTLTPLSSHYHTLPPHSHPTLSPLSPHLTLLSPHSHPTHTGHIPASLPSLATSLSPHPHLSLTPLSTHPHPTLIQLLPHPHPNLTQPLPHPHSTLTTFSPHPPALSPHYHPTISPQLYPTLILRTPFPPYKVRVE